MLGIGYTVRRYDWGSLQAIPDLLGVEPDGRPWAELWFGDHESGPSALVEPGGVGFHLDGLIHRDPATALGPDHARWGDRLPYMLKVLGVAAPLSLQVHPGRERAREGFAREEAAGVPLDAPHRSYRDPRPKPEMVFALSRFEALAGLRPATEARAALEGLDAPLARKMAASLEGPGALRRTMASVLGDETSPAAVDGLVAACACRRREGTGDVAAYSLVARLAAHYPADPGVAASLLMRHVVLAPGEALAVPTGMLHAYLEGLAVEVLGASDNVLRAGLTPKHRDVPELLGAMDDAHTAAPRPREVRDGPVRRFLPPFEDFQLIDVRVDGPVGIDVPGPRIGLVLSGAVFAAAGGHTRRVEPGQGVFVLGSDGPLRVHGAGRLIVAAPGK
ncbi:MAG: mannose-6-phosphate isomerase, class I [Bifidobacteriaceae bacterium]|jgi:mannose-6-phosphate isomerase|nr:mannose-6-phosphate isomerase, class I [Bifidobacteriaceae bacterium]